MNKETLIDIDGNEYKTVKIGKQIWMAENLRVTHYKNGDPIQKVEGRRIFDETSRVFSTPIWDDSDDWAGFCHSGLYCAYRNDETEIETYGYLYSGNVVLDERGIAPDGWRVPEDYHWMDLEMYLGMSESEANESCFRGKDEGSKLKKEGITGWSVHPYTKEITGTNETGFSAIPAGFREGHQRRGLFSAEKNTAYFWTATPYSYGSHILWYRALYADEGQIRRDFEHASCGHSIRLIKE